MYHLPSVRGMCSGFDWDHLRHRASAKAAEWFRHGGFLALLCSIACVIQCLPAPPFGSNPSTQAVAPSVPLYVYMSKYLKVQVVLKLASFCTKAVFLPALPPASVILAQSRQTNSQPKSSAAADAKKKERQNKMNARTPNSEFLERHTRKCSICSHPHRDAIEEEFLHWHRVIWIAQEYEIPDHRSIHRHARATGLLQARRENLHSALDNIVEQSDGIRATPDAILRAMRAYSCIDAHGRWTDLHKQVTLNYAVGNRIVDRAAAGTHLAREGSPGGTDTPARPDAAISGGRVCAAPLRDAAPASTSLVGRGLSPDVNNGPSGPNTFEAQYAEPAAADEVPAEAPETALEPQMKKTRPQADTFSAPASPGEAGAEPSKAETSAGDGLAATGGADPNLATIAYDPTKDPDSPEYIEQGPETEEQKEKRRKAEALRQRDIWDRAAGINRYPYGHPLR